MKTYSIKIIALSILFMFLVSCSNPEKVSQRSAESPITVKIGWIGPLTGPSAVLGMDSAVAAKIAVDDLNEAGSGIHLQLVVEDDQYDTVKAVTAYNKLVNVDGARILLVNTYSAVSAFANQAKEDGVLLIDPLDCNSRIVALGEHVLCLATDSESIGQVIVDQLKDADAKKVGLIHFNSDAFMPLVKDVIVERAPIPVVVGSYSGGTSDFKTILLKMMQDGVDSLVFLGYDETGIAMKQARDLGFSGRFYATGTVTSPSLQDASKGTAEGTTFAFWDAPTTNEPSSEFASRFLKIQGRPPILDLATYPSYDAVKAIHDGLVGSKNGNTPELVKSIINNPGFDGVTGFVKFNQDGSMRIPETAHVLKDGKSVKI